MGKIFYIMGKSSTGKDSLYRELLERLPLLPVVTYTTRPMRENEQEGREYHFVSRGVLEEMKASGDVIESRSYNTVHGEWTYFTSRKSIDLAHHDYLGIGTLESYVKVLEFYGAENVVPLYIEVEDGLRLARAVERERRETAPRYAELCRRFLADSEDFSEEKLTAAGIIRRFGNNGSFGSCLGELEEYIRSQLI